MIDVRTYVKPHNNGEGGGGGTTIINGGKSSTYNSINVSSINASKGNIDYLNVKSISGNEAQFIYFQTREGQIIKLSGNELKYNSGYIGTLNSDDISSKKITTDELEAINAYIDTLNSREITTEYLTVTKQAHFFELVIDKIKSVGGNIILTPASCIIDYVWGVDHDTGYLVHPDENNIDDIDYFYVFWRTSDDNGRSITNDFIAGDQAYCQSFNNVSTGVNYNVANKYYWRLVKSVGFDYIITDGQWPYQMYVNFSTGELSETENNTEVNQFDITLFNTKTKYKNNSSMYENKIEWKCEAQVFRDADGNPINGIETNVRWQDGERASNEAVHGIFSSASQVYGIEIKPVNDAKQCNVTNYLEFRIRQTFGGAYFIPEKINIGIYFTDDTFKVFNNVNIGSDYTYSITLDDVDAPIEAITIVSAADVNWHLCHCMKLSNIFIPKSNSQEDAHIPAANSERDWGLNNFASTPSEGDNIVQLGYRSPYNDTDDDPELNENSKFNRQNAIIISAYNTIDKGGRDSDNNIIKPLLPPSYAQYRGIDDFNLFTHRWTYMDANGATFRGDILMWNGTTLDDKIREVRDEEYWKNCYLSTYLNNITFVYDRDTTVTTISPTSLDLYIMWYESADEYESRVTVPQGWYVSVRGYYKDGTPTGSYVYQSGASLGTINISNLVHLNLDATNINNLRTLTFTLFKSKTGGDDVVNRLSLPIIYTEDAKDGQDGQDGDSTEVIQLVPKTEILMAAYITGLVTGNCNLVCNLDYDIAQMLGDEIDTLTWTNYRLRLTAYNASFTPIWTTTQSSGTYSPGNPNNLLIVINPVNDYSDPNYHDYMKCSSPSIDNSTDYRERCPYYLKVELIDASDNKKVYDTRIVYVKLEEDSMWMKTKDMIVSAVAGSESGTTLATVQDWVYNYYTESQQLANKITSIAGSSVVTEEMIDQKIAEATFSSDAAIQALSDYYTKNEVDNLLGSTNSFETIINLHDTTEVDGSKGNFAGDQNTFYLVTLSIGNETNLSKNGPWLTLQVDCMLDEFTYDKVNGSHYPNWGNRGSSSPVSLSDTSGTNRGVGLICNWNTITSVHGEWANVPYTQYINQYELKWTAYGEYNVINEGQSNEDHIKVIGNIEQQRDTVTLYLRGGAKYHFRYTWPNLYAGINVYSGSGNQSIHGHNYSKQITNISAINIPTMDRMWRSEIVQTASGIALNVWTQTAQGELELTGIDIGNHKINLNANNTNVHGTLNVYKSSTGNPKGLRVWNDTVSNAKTCTQITNDDLGSIQDYTISGLADSSTLSTNILANDGLILTGPPTNGAANFDQFVWWGKSLSNKYEFIARNKNYNLRVSEDGLLRSEMASTSNGSTVTPNSIFSHTGKEIIGTGVDEYKWTDISSTVPVLEFSQTSADFTSSSSDMNPDNTFRTHGIFIATGSGLTTVYIPHGGNCIGRVITFRSIGGTLKLMVHRPSSNGSFFCDGDTTGHGRDDVAVGSNTVKLVGISQGWLVMPWS